MAADRSRANLYLHKRSLVSASQKQVILEQMILEQQSWFSHPATAYTVQRNGDIHQGRTRYRAHC